MEDDRKSGDRERYIYTWRGDEKEQEGKEKVEEREENRKRRECRELQREKREGKEMEEETR